VHINLLTQLTTEKGVLNILCWTQTNGE
jgi:hypothetical protein